MLGDAAGRCLGEGAYGAGARAKWILARKSPAPATLETLPLMLC